MLVLVKIIALVAVGYVLGNVAQKIYNKSFVTPKQYKEQYYSKQLYGLDLEDWIDLVVENFIK